MATELDLGRYKLGWSDVEDYVYKPRKGLNEEVIREMSRLKREPAWMLEFRLKAYRRFLAKPMQPWFATKMPDLDFDDIYYYIKPTESQVDAWDELPESVKTTYERLGIPEAERKYLAGVTAQYECLRGATLVWTTGGMRPIKDLGEGDVVFSLDEGGRTVVVARVRAQRCSGVKEVFEVTANDQVIGASANHPFLTLRRDGAGRLEPTWVRLEELRVGDLVAVATDTPDFGAPAPLRAPEGAPVAYPTATSASFCWWAGVYLRAGSARLVGGRTELELALDPASAQLGATVAEIAASLLRAELAPDRARGVLAGRADASLAEFLEANGLGQDVPLRQVPQWAFALSRAERLALLAGYLDAGGELEAGAGGRVLVPGPNAVLLEGLRELALLSGVRAALLPGDEPGAPGRLELTDGVGRLLDASRRAPAPRRSDGAPRGPVAFVPVDAIEPVGAEPVFDIEVEGHHNFVAEGFFVHNSEVVYHRNREDLERRGVLFTDMDTAVREYPEIVRRYFGRVIPPNDNKFAALNSAVWSGGSFIYVPPGVTVDMPLQAYFRINAENMGQFERTLIIADEGSQVHYVEGCSAPVYSSDSLHAAVVELVALPGSRITYTTIQNWSTNVYNLVTKRARAEAEAHVEWVDGNIGCLAQGSRVTTRSGPKPIELVSPGDEVLSLDEASGELCFRKVTAKRFSGYQRVREVRLGTRALRVTDNHPFYASTGTGGRAYVRADRLERVVVPTGAIDYGHPHKLRRPDAMVVGGAAHAERGSWIAEAEETSDDLVWLLGLAAASRAAHHRLSLTLPAQSPARVRLAALVGEDALRSVAARPGEPARVGLRSAELDELTEANGLAAGPLPGWLLALPTRQRRSFLDGVLDAQAPGGRGLVSADRALLEGVADVLTSLGAVSRLVAEAGDEGRWRLEVVSHGSLGAPAGRPPAAALEVHDVAVGEPSLEVPTWDIEVEGTGNFVAEGFVVHNSRLTMKYPSVFLMGPKASGEVLSVAYAGEGQMQDTGAKMIHCAPETTSTIVSKSISKDGGVTTYRGKVHVDEGAKRAKSYVRCDALILDEASVSETKPYMEVAERDAEIGHEATVSKVGDDELFYLMSRGLSEAQATSMIVNGFIEPVTRTLPMEYAVEWSRLIELQMEGSVG